MKRLRVLVLHMAMIGIFLVLQNCSKNKVDPTPKENTENILRSKTWVVSYVTVPNNTATESSDWVDFTVTFSESSMATNGHAAGAEAVWPSGTYTVSEDGRTVTRGDGIPMLLTDVTEAAFTSTFSIDGEDIDNGRLASLDGEYIFSMK